jgi:hypothetical protein
VAEGSRQSLATDRCWGIAAPAEGLGIFVIDALSEDARSDTHVGGQRLRATEIARRLRGLVKLATTLT